MDMLHKCKLLVFLQQSVQEPCLVELRKRLVFHINFLGHDDAKATYMSMFCIKCSYKKTNLDITTIITTISAVSL